MKIDILLRLGLLYNFFVLLFILGFVVDCITLYSFTVLYCIVNNLTDHFHCIVFYCIVFFVFYCIVFYCIVFFVFYCIVYHRMSQL